MLALMFPCIILLPKQCSYLSLKMFSSPDSQSSSSEYSQSSIPEESVSPPRPCNEPRLARLSYEFIASGKDVFSSRNSLVMALQLFTYFSNQLVK